MKRVLLSVISFIAVLQCAEAVRYDYRHTIFRTLSRHLMELVLVDAYTLC